MRSTIMNERTYLFLIGVYLLVALYFDFEYMIYSLVILFMLEGLSGMSLATTFQKARRIKLDHGLFTLNTPHRFNIDALSVWRVIMALVLASSLFLLEEYEIEVLWFFPWFMGFAIMGAGVSGICPLHLGLRWAGFR